MSQRGPVGHVLPVFHDRMASGQSLNHVVMQRASYLRYQVADAIAGLR